jgi:hypothetical protein
MNRDRGEADREARRQREARQREQGLAFSQVLRERVEQQRISIEDVLFQPSAPEEEPQQRQ